jgi:hypothetical protein
MAFDKNRALDNDRYSSGPTALKAEHLDGHNAAVITVVDIEEVEFPDADAPAGKRYVLVLKSSQFPDRGFFLNKTGRKTMTERFGSVPARWINKTIPLVVVRVPNPKNAGKIQDSLQVATDDDWDEVLAEMGGGSRRAARKATGKRAAKKATKKK